MTYSVAGTPPSAEALTAIMGPDTRVLRKVEIYEQDGTTIWKSRDDIGVLSGSINVDQTRQERRVFQLTLDNSDGSISHAPDGLWYDKIIKVWRGIQYDSLTEDGLYLPQVGEFMIDEVSSANFPATISLQGRDYTKKLKTSKFKYPTSFAEGVAIESVIKTIAVNGGISPNKIVIPYTAKTTGKDWYFDKGTERWKAMTDIATNYGYELYFDGSGFLVMVEFSDPSTTASIFTFRTGVQGNLVSYSKASRDARLYNSVVVTGESSNKIPVYAVAENHTPGSPTSIEEIGERVYEYSSEFITTQQQADAVARQLLWSVSLEEFDVTLNSIVLPWLEAGNIVEFEDPTAEGYEPDRFLFSNFEIPLSLGAMRSTSKRVIRLD